jgi:hypothetical protein
LDQEVVILPYDVRRIEHWVAGDLIEYRCACGKDSTYFARATRRSHLRRPSRRVHVEA